MRKPRPEDYPFRDDDGYLWYNPITFQDPTDDGFCFICGEETDRIDVTFEAYYCGDAFCDNFIREELERLGRRE